MKRYNNNGNSRPSWNSLGYDSPDPRDCLAAYLLLETAEVLSGVKPANMISLNNGNRICGKNFYEIWKRYGRDLFCGENLEAREMVDRGHSILLLIYHRSALQYLLSLKKVAAVLTREGYSEPTNLDAAIAELQRRLGNGIFPHEVGVFLGYPLKDVLGFMGRANIPFTCQGPWKIYGAPAESLALAAACRTCRIRMARHLSRCRSPLHCLTAPSRGLKSHNVSGRNR